MKHLFPGIIGVFLLSACASIVSDSLYPIRITSNPEDAKVTIVDINGMEVYNGEVPATVHLEAGARFFKKQQYTLTFSSPGYQSKTIPLQCKVDGWYWGNLLLGGVIGMVIVDPATGAMYKFNQESISTTLQPDGSATLLIKKVDDLTALEKDKLEFVTRLAK